MKKKEYLRIKFEKDFLRYTLLQEDSLSPKEICNRVYDSIHLSKFVNVHKNKLEELFDTYLSFNKMKEKNGHLSNELPDEFDLCITDKIIGLYKTHLDCHCNKDLTDTILRRVLTCIELQTWNHGICCMKEAIDLFAVKLRDTARDYIQIQKSPLSKEELTNAYQKAKENSFLEKIQDSNIEDIISYRNVLIECIRTECENYLYEKMKDIYLTLAAHHIFSEIQCNFSFLLNYALQKKKEIPEVPLHNEWDKEYNQLIPTQFYFRNVERITAEEAFHIILLQIIAKEEKWMIEEKLLANGELNLFVGDKENCIKLLKLAEHRLGILD